MSINTQKISDYYRQLSLFNQQREDKKFKRLRIAILHSFTVEMISPILEVRLFQENIEPVIFFGGYNQYAQEILQRSSAFYKFKPDLILLFIRVEDMLPNYIWEYGEKSNSKWTKLIKIKALELSGLIKELNKNLNSQILIQDLSLASEPYFGIFDSQISNNQENQLSKFNNIVKEQLKHLKNVFFWDYKRFLQKYSFDSIFDDKLWYISKNPYKQNAYIKIVDDLLPYILGIIGRSKKCIVLDLDNTLWGGIAGEDGIPDIKLGFDYPGNCYLDFQKKLMILYNRGIILAINSKNNEDDAFDIIDNHPYMVLKRHHFAATQINWNNKADNLKIIAKDINIGLESIVFIDDNPIECDLVRQQLPMCSVIQLPEKPYLIPSVINELPGIENIRLTEEDKKKGSMYQNQIKRKEFENNAVDLDSFLKSLETKVYIKKATKFSIPRISQLTQKTNQFNMTTKRYSEAEIVKASNSSCSYVFSVSSKDKFGDNGIIGVIILVIKGKKCHIDTLLLSCRVIGREIEKSMVAFIAKFSKQIRVSELVGIFIQTKKNTPASLLYNNVGFKQESEQIWIADLKKQVFKYSKFLDTKNDVLNEIKQ